jgi:ribosome-associated toxin RatA of RatAB toxin-antitoxin module
VLAAPEKTSAGRKMSVHCMKTVHKSVLIWYSAQEMYNLVTDVAQYPQFLPWCSHAQVLEQNKKGMVAQLGLSIGGLRHSFTTRNAHENGKAVHLELVDGPFSELQGHWAFKPIGAEGERACKVELTLRYGFANEALALLISPVFDAAAQTLVDAFVRRADAVYASDKRAA